MQYIKIEKKFSNFTDTRKQLYHKQIKQQATNCLISSKIAATELLNLTGKYQDCDRKINPLSSDAIFALKWGEKKIGDRKYSRQLDYTKLCDNGIRGDKKLANEKRN